MKPITNRNQLKDIRTMTTIAILSAISAVLFMLEIPVVLFYKLDFSNLPVLLGTFSMGTIPGVAILFLKSALGLLHTTSQGVGELADFLMGVAMVIPAGMIYRHRKTRMSAVWGMVVGSIVATLVGVLSNVYLLIPFYGIAFGMPVDQIISMGSALIPMIDSVWSFVFLITAPFNLFKWAVISVLGAVIYKPLSPILHGRKR